MKFGSLDYNLNPFSHFSLFNPEYATDQRQPLVTDDTFSQSVGCGTLM